MLFYVQMKWNYQGRISQDELWELEQAEGAHGLEGIRSGVVLALYKVVSQHRVIALVDVDSLENLDRNSMGWLPMREYLEFEVVWALRDYAGFIDDVKSRFPQPPAGGTTPSFSTLQTQAISRAWYDRLGTGRFEEALALVHPEVEWINIAPVPGVSDLAPWLGTYHGLDAVKASFEVWARYSRMLSMNLISLTVQGDTSMAVVHEHAQCLANNNEYDLQVATQLTVVDGLIRKWQVYWDISPLVRAYKNL